MKLALLIARRAALALLLACATTAGAAGPSIDALQVPLTDQSGRAFTLADLRGTPMIVSMFYTNCQFVCPMLVEAIRTTEQQLSAAQRQHLKVLLVSFDPEHDTIATLARTATERRLDTRRWSLARTDARSVRKLAALLDIQYRALGNGEFNHSTALILVDAEGRIAARTGEMAHADPAFVKAVKVALAPGTAP